MFFVDFCEANKMCPVRETEYRVTHDSDQETEYNIA